MKRDLPGFGRKNTAFKLKYQMAVFGAERAFLPVDDRTEAFLGLFGDFDGCNGMKRRVAGEVF